MNAERVTEGLHQLVDHLRADPARSVTPAEAAAITEVLLTAMHRYFSSIDGAIYHEFRLLSQRIKQARVEIAALRPAELKEERLPRAGKELEAIVQSTEVASGTIMDAAETIMAADPGTDGYGHVVQENCLRIFEACSFQDLTGQRITKVVDTLTFIEERLHRMSADWAGDPKDQTPAKRGGDRALLSGPALPGEGIDQGQVDRLMAEPMPASPPAARAATKPAAKPAAAAARPAAAAAPKPTAAPASAAPAKPAVPPRPVETPAKAAPKPAGETISQDEIDALFG